ncbi:MAG TPA: hypothetical protein VEK10_02270 [Steroidobacteraceae bacterium]|nr:hypothetical protein [Steroidobacteraceae bacterium]
MRLLLLLSLLVAAPVLGQDTTKAQQTGSSPAATATAAQVLLRRQIDAQRLQTEWLRKQIEMQQQKLEQQRLQLKAAEDHQMRLERLQRSFVTDAACLRSNSPDYCAARDPELRAAKEDVARGRISEDEFVQAAQAADQQMRVQVTASQ